MLSQVLDTQRYTFISPATEKLEKQDKYEPRDKWYL